MDNHISENDQTPDQHAVAPADQPAEQVDPDLVDPEQAVADRVDPEEAVDEQVDLEESIDEQHDQPAEPDEEPEGYVPPVSIDPERTDYKAYYPHGLRLN